MTPKRVLLLAGAMTAIGLLLRALGQQWGLDVLLVALLLAVLSVALMLRSIQHELSTSRRNTAQRLQSLTAAQTALAETFEEHGKLQRTTLYYAKNGSSRLVREGTAEPMLPTDPHRTGVAGRSSTPEVSNSRASHSFSTALEATGTPLVTGLLSPAAERSLPDSVTVHPFLPFHARESLEAAADADLVVVDEAVFTTAPWDRAVGPVGISMMKDLVAALAAARVKGMQVVILSHGGLSDINGTALASIRGLRLPAREVDHEAASGAPMSPVMAALSAHAERREGS